MNQQPCEQLSEWMSLAQDNLLDNAQMRLLHAHLAECSLCQARWEGMALVSRLFHAAPLAAPAPGFAQRFERRLARREEQRRQLAIWALLAIGVIVLTSLAFPSILGTLALGGRLILPYETFRVIQGLFTWIAIVLAALTDAMWVLIRHFAGQPAAWACAGSAGMMGLLAAVWMRVLWTRGRRQPAR